MSCLTYRTAGAAAPLLLLPASECGGSSCEDTTRPADRSGQNSPTKTASAAVETTNFAFRTILPDDKARTLYMFDPDSAGRGTCDAECLSPDGNPMRQLSQSRSGTGD